MPLNEANLLQTNGSILKLSHDVLYFVFYHGSEMSPETESQYPVFSTLLRCSHVSSSWRQIIISAPILWARVINLRFLQKQEWREEVMRRTGRAAPLSITADPTPLFNPRQWPAPGSGHNDNNIDSWLVFALLEENWARIRYMDIFLKDSNALTFRDFRLVWQFLKRRPPPLLETFIFKFVREEKNEIYGGYKLVNIFPPQRFKPFDNHPPDLIRFDAPAIFDIQAPWLRHVSDLSLSGRLPVDELLRALSSMPLIETLQDKRECITHPSGSALLPKVSLPNLKEIAITSTGNLTAFGPYLDFFTHISPLSSNNIRLDFLMPTYGLNSWFLKDWRNFSPLTAILQLFSTLCGLRGATEVHMAVDRGRFSFRAVVPPHGSSQFYLEITDSVIPKSHLEDLFVSLTASVIFDNVQLLQFNIGTANLRPTDRVLIDLINSLSSAEVLMVQSVTSRYLVEVPWNIPPVKLPRLHTLKLFYCAAHTEVSLLEMFITTLLAAGRPLGILAIELTSCNGEIQTAAADMRWVKQFPELRILFFDRARGEQVEYIHGNSD